MPAGMHQIDRDRAKPSGQPRNISQVRDEIDLTQPTYFTPHGMDDRFTSMRGKRAIILVGWIVVLISLTAGCASYYRLGDPQRARSFAPYQNWLICGQPVQAFMSERTAILIPGDFVDSAREKDAWIAMCLRPQPNGTVVDGPSQAIAIDPRGYFLTADHCLTHPKLTIVYRTAEGLRVASPRVVARLPEADIAVLSVDSPVSATFQWASAGSLKAGDLLFSIGMDDPAMEGTTLFFHRRCLAGTVKRLESTPAGGYAVQHTLPLRPGDSGGPTVDLEGRLAAINSRVTVHPLRALESWSVLPDRVSMSQLMDADFRNR